MENEKLAKVFDAMAREKKKDRYRKIAYENAAAAIRRHPKVITSGKQAKSIVGIGESIANKIDEILKSGTLAILEDRSPEEVIEAQTTLLFEKIHGVGVKTAEAWYKKGYRTIEDLKAEYANMTDAQKLGYKYFEDLQKKIPREETKLIEDFLRKVWTQDFIIGGSYRRGESESNDIDVVVRDGITMEELLDPLIKNGFILGNLAIGTKHYMGIVSLNTISPGKKFLARRLDIQLVEEEQWPFTSLFFTGDKRLNIELRKRATSLGFTLGNYELTDNKGKQYYVKTEKDVFDILGVEYLEPEERKGGFVLSFYDPKLKQKGKELIKEEKEIEGWYRPSEDFFVYIGRGVVNTGKIAGFDLDGTLVRPSKGEFPKDPTDVVLIPNRIEVLKKYLNTGYMIAIFTNQKSRSDKEKLAKYTRVINAINLIDLPLILFMSTGDDEYRKPNTGMWDALKTMGVIKEAFYTGNSAGRKYDHSDVDILFAKNIGIQFFTPEEVFGI